jgi:hypothetical protein
VNKLITTLTQSKLLAILVVSLTNIIAFFAPFFALLSGSVIGLIALRKGTNQVMIVFAISAIPATILIQEELGRPAIALPLLLFLSLPVILIALLLNKTQSQGVAILTAAVVSALFVITLRLVFQDIDLFWTEWLGKTVKYVKGATVNGFTREGSLQFVTGLAASMVTLCMVLTTLISRWLQSLAYNPGGFSKEFHSLRIPKATTWITLTILTAYISFTYGKGNLLSDLLMIAAIIYSFQGLATLHGATQTIELPRMWLVITYLSLFLLPRFSIALLALIGLADSHFDFRSRKKPESP